MKKVYFLLLIVLSGIGCSKEDKVFSCDEDTNTWVKNNLSTIKTFTRANTLELEPIRVTAVFNAFSAQQRYDYWHDKLNEVISLQGWNESELAHLTVLKNEMVEEWFTDSFREDKAKMENFEKFKVEWVRNASADLGWSKVLIGKIIASGYRLKNKSGEVDFSNTLALSKTMATNSESSNSSCSCTTSDDWCASQSGHNDKCNAGNCTTTTWGCGWFFTSTCDGRCSYL